MPSHGYLPADKEAFKVCEQDFYFGGLHKKQVRHFDAIAKCTGCARAGKAECYKKLFFSGRTPETIGLKGKFSTFHNPVVSTGVGDAQRSALAISGNQKETDGPRAWHAFWDGCHDNRDCENFSDLEVDFRAVLQKKAPCFAECWRKYNEAKDKDPDPLLLLIYADADALFARARRLLDLLPVQPTEKACRPHKKRERAEVAPAEVGAAAGSLASSGIGGCFPIFPPVLAQLPKSGEAVREVWEPLVPPMDRVKLVATLSASFASRAIPAATPQVAASAPPSTAMGRKRRVVTMPASFAARALTYADVCGPVMPHTLVL